MTPKAKDRLIWVGDEEPVSAFDTEERKLYLNSDVDWDELAYSVKTLEHVSSNNYGIVWGETARATENYSSTDSYLEYLEAKEFEAELIDTESIRELLGN